VAFKSPWCSPLESNLDIPFLTLPLSGLGANLQTPPRQPIPEATESKGSYSCVTTALENKQIFGKPAWCLGADLVGQRLKAIILGECLDRARGSFSLWNESRISRYGPTSGGLRKQWFSAVLFPLTTCVAMFLVPNDSTIGIVPIFQCPSSDLFGKIGRLSKQLRGRSDVRQAPDGRLVKLL
jgi:hypothetical protein